MKIKINEGLYISDNTKECNDSKVIFVKTTLNSRYANTLNPDVTILTPKDLKKYLPHNIKIIAITGTNGKTTIASAIHFALRNLNIKSALLGTRGFFIDEKQISQKGLTTPTLLELYYNLHLATNNKCEFFVMEVSSHAIAQNRIEGIDFTLKIISNIQSDHLDFHKNLKEYKRVKNSFFSDCTLKLINSDCKECEFNDIKAFTYGIDSNAMLKATKYTLKSNEMSANIIWRDENQIWELHSKLIGKYNLYNLLAAIGALKLILSEKSLGEIIEVIGKFRGVPGRMQIVNKNPLVIVDFAHTPDGMKNIFEAFNEREIKVIFGAGGDRDKTKRPLMGKIAAKYAKKSYITSDNPRSENPNDIINDIIGGIDNANNNISYCVEVNRALAIKQALDELQGDEILLILGKGDETYQIVGEKIIDFDDRLEVQKYFNNLESKHTN